MSCAIKDKETVKSMEYHQFFMNEKHKATWKWPYLNELGRLVQGVGRHVKVTDIFFMT